MDHGYVDNSDDNDYDCDGHVPHDDFDDDSAPVMGSFTLHVSILFLLGFGWDGHFRP